MNILNVLRVGAKIKNHLIYFLCVICGFLTGCGVVASEKNDIYINLLGEEPPNRISLVRNYGGKGNADVMVVYRDGRVFYKKGAYYDYSDQNEIKIKKPVDFEKILKLAAIASSKSHHYDTIDLADEEIYNITFGQMESSIIVFFPSKNSSTSSSDLDVFVSYMMCLVDDNCKNLP